MGPGGSLNSPDLLQSFSSNFWCETFFAEVLRADECPQFFSPNVARISPPEGISWNFSKFQRLFSFQKDSIRFQDYNILMNRISHKSNELKMTHQAPANRCSLFSCMVLVEADFRFVMDVRTPCLRIMITYLAVAWWINESNEFSDPSGPTV